MQKKGGARKPAAAKNSSTKSRPTPKSTPRKAAPRKVPRKVQPKKQSSTKSSSKPKPKPGWVKKRPAGGQPQKSKASSSRSSRSGQAPKKKPAPKRAKGGGGQQKRSSSGKSSKAGGMKKKQNPGGRKQPAKKQSVGKAKKPSSSGQKAKSNPNKQQKNDGGARSKDKDTQMMLKALEMKPKYSVKASFGHPGATSKRAMGGLRHPRQICRDAYLDAKRIFGSHIVTMADKFRVITKRGLAGEIPVFFVSDDGVVQKRINFAACDDVFTLTDEGEVVSIPGAFGVEPMRLEDLEVPDHVHTEEGTMGHAIREHLTASIDVRDDIDKQVVSSAKFCLGGSWKTNDHAMAEKMGVRDHTVVRMQPSDEAPKIRKEFRHAPSSQVYLEVVDAVVYEVLAETNLLKSDTFAASTISRLLIENVDTNLVTLFHNVACLMFYSMAGGIGRLLDRQVEPTPRANAQLWDFDRRVRVSVRDDPKVLNFFSLSCGGNPFDATPEWPRMERIHMEEWDTVLLTNKKAARALPSPNYLLACMLATAEKFPNREEGLMQMRAGISLAAVSFFVDKGSASMRMPAPQTGIFGVSLDHMPLGVEIPQAVLMRCSMALAASAVGGGQAMASLGHVLHMGDDVRSEDYAEVEADAISYGMSRRQIADVLVGLLGHPGGDPAHYGSVRLVEHVCEVNWARTSREVNLLLWFIVPWTTRATSMDISAKLKFGADAKLDKAYMEDEEIYRARVELCALVALASGGANLKVSCEDLMECTEHALPFDIYSMRQDIQHFAWNLADVFTPDAVQETVMCTTMGAVKSAQQPDRVAHRSAEVNVNTKRERMTNLNLGPNYTSIVPTQHSYTNVHRMSKGFGAGVEWALNGTGPDTDLPPPAACMRPSLWTNGGGTAAAGPTMSIHGGVLAVGAGGSGGSSAGQGSGPRTGNDASGQTQGVSAPSCMAQAGSDKRTRSSRDSVAFGEGRGVGRSTGVRQLSPRSQKKADEKAGMAASGAAVAAPAPSLDPLTGVRMDRNLGVTGVRASAERRKLGPEDEYSRLTDLGMGPSPRWAQPRPVAPEGGQDRGIGNRHERDAAGGVGFKRPKASAGGDQGRQKDDKRKAESQVKGMRRQGGSSESWNAGRRQNSGGGNGADSDGDAPQVKGGALRRKQEVKGDIPGLMDDDAMEVAAANKLAELRQEWPDPDAGANAPGGKGDLPPGATDQGGGDDPQPPPKGGTLEDAVRLPTVPGAVPGVTQRSDTAVDLDVGAGPAAYGAALRGDEMPQERLPLPSSTAQLAAAPPPAVGDTGAQHVTRDDVGGADHSGVHDPRSHAELGGSGDGSACS
jgi:hypothetical protein